MRGRRIGSSGLNHQYAAARAANLPEPNEPRTLSQLFGRDPNVKQTSCVGFTMP